MIVLDSGLGGLSVVQALRALQPNMPLIYVADSAGFPYGNRSAADIQSRAVQIVRQLNARHGEHTIVLACNTLSTLCLGPLRELFANRFVGTVPAIKSAAHRSHTRRFTLLATPNTAQSTYSSALIAQFAANCRVDRYGAPRLAAMAEAALLGTPLDDAALRAEIAPAFHNDGNSKTDCIVLGCTHYPLLIDHLKRVAPWEVTWVDSSAAIAKRALEQDNPACDTPTLAYVTAEHDMARYRDVFSAFGFAQVAALAMA